MVLISFVTVALLGLIAATLLTVASRLLYVQEDPQLEEVTAALPGVNCGGCGFASCETYAAAVLRDPAISAGLCVVGGAETAKAVGVLVGKAVDAMEPRFAFCACSKDEGQVKPRYFYAGIDSCAAASSLAGGPDECRYSCIGLGDCARACVFDAMVFIDGKVQILAPNCVACGACVRVCPRSVIELIPRRSRVVIHCSTKNAGKAVMDVCRVGCIQCMKCVKSCPAKAIAVEDGRVHINQAACLSYGPACLEVCVPACPRSILRLRHSNVQTLASPAHAV